MAAYYVISDADVLDDEQIRTYRLLAQESIARYGGRYLARGGRVEPIEGGWTPESIIIVEFPDMARAKAWYPVAGLCRRSQGARTRARPQDDLRRGRRLAGQVCLCWRP